MTSIDGNDRERLVKLLGLLGSDFAGERDAAGRAAMRLLAERGASWSDVLVASPERREPLMGTWRKTCAALAQRPGDLGAWERQFVANLPGFARLSTKQRHILSEIADRVLGARP